MLFSPQLVTTFNSLYYNAKLYLSGQLNQTIFPVFCDEGVYRIVLYIFLKCPEEFNNLIPIIVEFHMATCVEHCIGKFVNGCGLENGLL